MIGFLLTIAGFFAPLIVIIPVVREAKNGVPVPWWMNTPDDPSPPRGLYEPDQKAKFDRYGQIFAEWWWLGFRNSLYGLAYHFKPAEFKERHTYSGLEAKQEMVGSTRLTTVAGYVEKVYKLGPIGIITGYRVAPIYDAITKFPDEPVNHPNMAGRPCFSIRKYENCVG